MIWIVIIPLLLFIFILPRYGLLAQLDVWRENRQRERAEDTLKHLLDQQQEGRRVTLHSLARSLNLPRRSLTRLLSRMETQGLIQKRAGIFEITPEGTRWALHVMRAHRLWERYLADEARMPLEQIHSEAHHREHNLTPAQVDELDAALGHPTRDPHGDPIPTREGVFVEAEGTPLTGWQTEVPGRIVHLEDEPSLAYAQLLAEGLALGRTVHILEKTDERILLTDGENEYRLAPVIAANVFLAPLPEKPAPPVGALSLARLTHNQKAEIVALDEACQGFTRRRFLDLGLTPGTTIYPELRNSFGDPRGYRVRGTLIALRKDQAAQIWVRPVSSVQ